jgi:alkenylglycerophosphocholine hydrolase
MKNSTLIMKKILLAFFIVSGLLFCLSIIIENQLLNTITKPIPMIVLILLIKPQNLYNKLIFIGFIFSLLGDVFLLQVIDRFILGLAAFLIAHIFYIVGFYKRVGSLKLLSSIPFYLTAGVLFYFFYPFLGEMLIPVSIYTIVIMTMVWRSYLQRNFDKYAVFAFIGAILFAISDSNIALTKFIQDYQQSQYVTIILYWTGQYLIYRSTQKA